MHVTNILYYLNTSITFPTRGIRRTLYPVLTLMGLYIAFSLRPQALFISGYEANNSCGMSMFMQFHLNDGIVSPPDRVVS